MGCSAAACCPAAPAAAAGRQYMHQGPGMLQRRSPRELKARKQWEQKAAAVECWGQRSSGCSASTVSPEPIGRAATAPRPFPGTSFASRAAMAAGSDN